MPMDPDERLRLERIVVNKRRQQEKSAMDPDERRKLERLVADKRMMKGPVTEDQGMALATRAAERKYEEDAPGIIETAAGQFAQGLSFGTADEGAAHLAKTKGIPYDQAKHQINQRLLQQRLKNPGTAITADIIGSIVSSLIPGLGVVAAPAKLARGAKLLHGAGQMAKQAGIGAAEGFARGEGDDRLENALTTGVIAGVAPAAMAGVSQGGKAVKGLVPGTTGTPKILNKATAGLAKMVSKLDDDTTKAYQKMLDEPEVLRKAFTSPQEIMAQVPTVNKELSEQFQSINTIIKNKYDQKQAEAFAKNVGDSESFMGLLKRYDADIDAAIAKVDSMPEFYSAKTKGVLERLKSIIGLKDPKVGDLTGKLDKLQNEVVEAAKKGDAADLQRLSKEYKNFSKELGGALVRGRRNLDSGISFKPGESLPDDQVLLLDLRDKIQKMTHQEAKGAELMKEADALYSNFKGQAEPFMKQFKGKGPDELSAKRVGDFVSGAGSPYRQAEIEAYHKSAKDFFEKFGMQKEAKALDDFIEKYSHFKNRLEIGRVGGQTGATTGRSLGPLGMGAIGTYLGGPGLGAAMAVLTTPVATPTAYARTLNSIREMVANTGESEVAKQFGRAWPAIKGVLSRRINTQEDVAAAAEEIKRITGDEFQQGGSLDTGAIPQKVRQFLKNGRSNQGAAVRPSISPKIKQRITNRGLNK